MESDKVGESLSVRGCRIFPWTQNSSAELSRHLFDIIVEHCQKTEIVTYLANLVITSAVEP